MVRQLPWSNYNLVLGYDTLSTMPFLSSVYLLTINNTRFIFFSRSIGTGMYYSGSFNLDLFWTLLSVRTLFYIGIGHRDGAVRRWRLANVKKSGLHTP
jgi:hypothetical protein